MGRARAPAWPPLLVGAQSTLPTLSTRPGTICTQGLWLQGDYTQVYTCIYTYTDTGTHSSVHMYTHTHTHTQTHPESPRWPFISPTSRSIRTQFFFTTPFGFLMKIFFNGKVKMYPFFKFAFSEVQLPVDFNLWVLQKWTE